MSDGLSSRQFTEPSRDEAVNCRATELFQVVRAHQSQTV